MTYFHKAKDPKEDTLPKVIENTKTSMMVLGKNTSEIIKKVLTEMHLLRKPNSVKLSKKNDILPFEDATSLEFFSEKNDSSLFLFGNHSKKRPHNLILGRMFNYKMLDMVELGVEEFKEMNKSTSIVNQAGSKPCLLFQGPHFENDETLKVVKNLFMDFFRLDVVKKINILGLDHVIVITSLSEKKLHFGHYSIRYTQAPSSSGTMTDVPLVELIDCGPSMFLNVRRSKFASEDLRKEAMKIPDQLKKSKSRNKNVTINALGDMEGRLHIQQQNISGIATRRFKAFKKGTEEEEENIRAAIEGEDGGEGQDANDSAMETD